MMDLSWSTRSRIYFKQLWSRFVHAYTSRFVLKWSLWWALASFPYYFYTNNIQTLYQLNLVHFEA